MATYKKVKNVVLGVTAVTAVVATAYTATNLFNKERDYSDILVESAKKYVEKNNLAIESELVASASRLKESGSLVGNLNEDCVDGSYVTIKNEDGTYKYEPSLVCETVKEESTSTNDKNIASTDKNEVVSVEKALTYKVNASSTKLTNGNVEVQVVFSEQIHAVEVTGWTLSSDKKILTKIFTENGEDEFQAVSLDGYKSVVVKINASNIDKDAPQILINGKDVLANYVSGVKLDVKDENLESVKVNGKDLTDYTINETGKYEVEAIDEAGNKATATFSLGRASVNPPKINKIVDGGVYPTLPMRVTYSGSEATLYTLEGDDIVEEKSFISGAYIRQPGSYRLTVKNSVGDSITANFIIDNDDPEVWAEDSEGNAITDGKATNKNVKVYFSDKYSKVTAKSNTLYRDLKYGEEFSKEGDYVITVTDGAGHVKELRFKIDKSVPNINGVADGKHYSSSRTIVFDPENTALLNGVEISRGHVVSEEGEYNLVVTTEAGTPNIVDFVIDKTSPVIVGFESTDSIVTGDDFEVEATDKYLKSIQVKKGETVIANEKTTLTEEGIYTIIATDQAGNTTTKTVTVDKNAPTVIVGGTDPIKGAGVIDKAFEEEVSFTVEDLTQVTVKVDGKDFTGNTITANGRHTLEVTDEVGHTTTVYFTIAKDVPEVKLITDGNEIVADNEMLTHYFNKDVTIKISNNVEIKSAILTTPDGDVELTQEEILNGKTITAIDEKHNSYKLVVIDVADRSVTVNFVTDLKNPTSSVVSETYTTDQLITFEDQSGVTATLDGVSIESGKVTLTEEGLHTLMLTDKAGNSVVYYPVIDKSAPEVSFVMNGEETSIDDLTKKIYFSENVTVSLSDDYSLLKVSVNGEEKQGFSANSKEFTIELSSDGEYLFVAEDKAGHSVEFTVVVDTEDPVGSISYENIADPTTDRFIDSIKMTLTLDEDYTISDSNKLDWKIENSAIEGKVQYTYILNDSMSGNVTLTDKAGNELEIPYNAIIDKDAATANISYSTTDPISGDVIITMITSEPVNFEDDKLTWSEGELITDGENKGKYEYTATAEENVENDLVLVDGNGNKTEISYTVKNIDKIVDIIPDSEGNKVIYSNNGQPTNEDVTLTINAKEQLSFTDNILTWAETVNGTGENKVYTYTAIADDNYSNTLEITDSLNNEISLTYSVTGIDKNGPEVTGFDEDKYNEETDSYLFNTSVTPEFTEGTAVLKKKNANGEYEIISNNFLSGTTIGEANTDESYLLEVKDAVNNKTIKKFRIDRKIPTATHTLSTKNPTNQAVTITVNVSEPITVIANADNIKYLEGNTGFTYLMEEPGKVTFRFEDEAGNVGSIEVDAPNIDKVGPTIEGITNGGKYGEYVTNIIISDNKTGVTATLDGVAITGEALENGLGFKIAEIQDGVHTLVVTDTAGNSITYTFTVDTISPIITGVENNGLYNSGVTPKFTEGTATLVRVYKELVDDELVEKTETIDDFKSETLVDKEGTYTLTVDDGITSETVVTFTIDKTAPTANITTVTSNGKTYTNGYVTITITASEPINMVSNQEIVEVSDDRKTYKFKATQNGEITFQFKDDAENPITKTVNIQSIDRTVPKVSGVNKGGLYNANQIPFEITYRDDHDVSATLKRDELDEEPFISGSKITEEGTYTLVVTDEADNSVTYTFEVDTTPPEVTLPEGGIEINGKLFYSKSVSPEYTEGTGTLEVKVVDEDGNESYVVVDTYDKEEAISLDGEYRLTVKDLAGNKTIKEFVIDKTAPVATTTADIIAPTNGDVTLTLTMSEAITMLSTHDNMNISDDRKEVTVVVSENGTITFQFKDDVGNVGSATFTVNNIDTEMLSGEITADKDNDTPTLAPVTLTLTVNEPIKNLSDSDLWTFVPNTSTNTPDAGELTNATPVPDQTPVTYTREVTQNGTYTVTYTDMAGNAGTATYTVSNIDTGAPVITIVEGTNLEDYPSIYTSDVKVKIEDQNLKSATYTLNGTEHTIDLSTLADGKIVFQEDGTYVINAVDVFDQTATSVSFSIDKTTPVVEIEAETPEDKVTEDLYKGNVIVTIDEANIKSIKVNGVEESSIWTEKIFDKDGTYSIVVTDKAGRESNEIRFSIDTVASKANVSYSTTEITTNPVIVTVKVDEPINIDGWTAKDSIIEGGKILYVYEKEITSNTEGKVVVTYTDEATNEGTFEYIVSNIDLEAPTITITEGTLVKDNLYSTATTVEVADPEGNISEVYVNGQLDATFTSSKTKTFDKDEEYTIKVVDVAGHETEETIVVDVTAPVITIEGGNLMVVTDGANITLPTVTVSDAIDKTVQATIKSDVTENMVRKVTYTATDEAGHTADDVVLEIRIIDISELDQIEAAMDALLKASEGVEFTTALENNKLDYTVASWNTKENMIAELKKAIAGTSDTVTLEDVTQDFVDAEIEKIAKYELVSETLNTESFEELVVTVGKLDRDDYEVSDDLWNQIQDLANNTVIEDIDVQSTLNKVVADLSGALEALDETAKTVVDDTEDYKNQYEEIDYAGYDEFVEALDKLSSDVADGTIKLQSEYDAQIDKIVEALQSTKNTIDDTDLIAIEKEFENLDELDYTTGSYNALKSAIDAARDIVDADGKISEYNDAMDAITVAKEALIAIPKVLNPVLKTSGKPGYAKLGDTLTLEFESNEELNIDYDEIYRTTLVLINGEVVSKIEKKVSEETGKTIYVAKVTVKKDSTEGYAKYSITPAGPVGPNQVSGTTVTNTSDILVDRTTAKVNLGVKPSGQTQGPVTVTITADEKIILTGSTSENESGTSVTENWTQADTEGKVYTLEVAENKTITVNYTDEAGNEGSKIIDVPNIDKAVPTATITADITTATKEDVVLTLIASEPIDKISEGWTPDDEDGMVFTYTVKESKIVNVEFVDYAGNSGEATYDATYIDKTPATIGTPVYSNDGHATIDDVIITITSSEKITFEGKDDLIDENGLEWKEISVTDNEGNVVSYKYVATATDNVEASFTVLDHVGNESTFSYKVVGIDRVEPVLESIKSMYMAEGQRYTNIKYDILVMTFNKPVKINTQSVSLVDKDGNTLSQEDRNKYSKVQYFRTSVNFGLMTTFSDELGRTGKINYEVNQFDHVMPTLTSEIGSLYGKDMNFEVTFDDYERDAEGNVTENDHKVSAKLVDADGNETEILSGNVIKYKAEDAVEEDGVVLISGGKYTLVITDEAGNSIQKAFEVDVEGPNIEVTNNGSNGDKYIGPVNIKVTDVNGIRDAHVEIAGQDDIILENGVGTLTKGGSYKVVATDNLGNTSELEFTIEDVPEVVSIKSTVMKDGQKYTNAKEDILVIKFNKPVKLLTKSAIIVDENGVTLTDEAREEYRDTHYVKINVNFHLTVTIEDELGQKGKIDYNIVQFYRETPTITVEGNRETIVIKDTDVADFELPTVSASTKNEDVKVTIESDKEFDKTQKGEQVITYTATDEAGNTATKTITVRVLDTTGLVREDEILADLEAKATGNFYERTEANKDDYTLASWNAKKALVDALKSDLSGNISATIDQAYVDAKVAEIEASELVSKGFSTTEYDKLVQEFNELHADDYDKENYASIAEIIENFDANNIDATTLQSTFNKDVYLPLKEQIEELVARPNEVTIVTDEYKNSFKAEDYAGKDAFLEALDNLAQEVEAGNVTLQSDYDAKVAEIEDALLLTKNAIDDEELVVIETEFAGMNAEDYTDTTYEALKSAIEEARAIVTNDGKISEYNDAMEAVRTAKDALMALPKVIAPELSTNGTNGYAKEGNKIKVEFTSNKALDLTGTAVMINGKLATLSYSEDEETGVVTYTATTTVAIDDENGKVIYSITLVDEDGLTGTVVTNTEEESTVTVDTTPPNVDLSEENEVSEGIYTGSVTVTVTDANLKEVYVDGVVDTTFTTTKTFTSGSHTIKAVDMAGNESDEVTFAIYTEAPEISFGELNDAIVTVKNKTIDLPTFTATDSNGNMLEVEVSKVLYNGKDSNGNAIVDEVVDGVEAIDYSRDGIYTITYSATDAAGLEGTKNLTIRVLNVDRYYTMKNEMDSLEEMSQYGNFFTNINANKYDYTEKSWNDRKMYIDAMEYLTEPNLNSRFTQEMIDNYMDIIDSFKLVPEKLWLYDYNDQLAIIDTLVSTDYTTDSWMDLIKYKNEASTGLKLQSDVNYYTKTLASAIDSLVKEPVTDTTDAYKNKYQSIDYAGYEAYVEALDELSSQVADKTVDLISVYNSKLKEIEDALLLTKNAIDDAELVVIETEFAGMKAEDYTDETYEALKNAIEEARAIVTNNGKISEYNEAMDAIKEAKGSLIIKLKVLSEEMNTTGVTTSTGERYAKPGDTLTLVFSTNSTLTIEDTVVTINGKTATLTSSVDEEGNVTYIATLVVSESDVSGKANYTISLQGPNGQGNMVEGTSDITIDTEAPNGNVSYVTGSMGSEVEFEDGDKTNKDVTIKVKTYERLSDIIDSNGYDWLLNGVEIESDPFGSDPDIYYYRFTVQENTTGTIKLKDMAGNVSEEISYEVTGIDKQAPTATIVPSTEETTNQDIELILTPSEELSTISDGWVKQSDGTYTLSVSTNETYTVTFTDEVGNPGTASYTVTNIDKVKPVVNVSYTINGIPFAGGFTNKDVTVTITSDKRLATITDGNVDHDWLASEQGTTDGEGNVTGPYTYSMTFSSDVTETVLVIADEAGNAPENEITYSVAGIDKVNPVIEVTSDGNLHSEEIYDGKVNVKITDTNLKAITYVETINGVSTTKIVPIVNGMGTIELGDDTVTEATYEFSATDEATNNANVSFKIDTKDPVISGVTDGGKYEDSVTVTVADANLKEVTFEGPENGTFEGASHEFVLDGTYTVTAKDYADHTVTVTFTIDQTDPVITGFEGGTDVDGETVYDHELVITFNKGSITANGEQIASGDTLSDGKYEIVIKTPQGTIIDEKNIIVDATAPVINGVEDGEFYDDDVTIDVVEDNVVFIKDQNGNAVDKNATFTSDGQYTITVKDIVGREVSKTFTIDKTPPKITLNGSETNYGLYGVDVTINVTDTNIESIVDAAGNEVTDGQTFENGTHTIIATDKANNQTTVIFTVDKVAPTVTGVEDGGKYSKAPTITFDKGTATLNGTEFTSGSTVEDGKDQTLVVTSDAGITTTITFTVDTVAPNITSITNGGVYQGSVTISFDDATTIPTGMIGDKLVANGSVFKEEGTHTLIVTDETGNNTSVTFTIDNTAPVLEITDNKGVKHTTDFEVTLEADKSGKFTNFDYTVSDREGVDVNVTVTGTADVTTIGDYKLEYVATDDVGNETSIEVTVHVKDNTKPVITMGQNGQAIEVVFGSEFSDPYGATANDSYDGVVNVKATNNVDIYNIGTYKITYTATDASGNKATAERTVNVVKTDTGKLFRTANKCREGTQCYGSYASNNYVWYSGHLWRVIKVNPDNTLKLIAEDAASGFSFDDNSSTFAGSNAEKWLNNVFYPSLANADSIVTTGEFCNEQLTSTTAVRYTCSAGSVVKSKVGLLTIDEYNILGGQNSFLNNGHQFFTMTPTSEDTTWVVEDTGTKERGYYVTEPYAMRPVININRLDVLRGRGTEKDPFVVDENKGNKTGTNLTSSVSGEYVNFGGKTWRVVSSSNEGTKLITNDYIKVNGSYQKQAFGSAGVFNTTSGIGYYLNNTIYNGFTTTQKSLIKLSRWYTNSYTFGQNPMDTTLVNGSKYTDAYVGLIRVGELMSGSTTATATTDKATYWTLNYTGSNSWFVSWGGTSEISPATDLRGVRPVITINNDAVITSGDGTEAHPYEIQ